MGAESRGSSVSPPRGGGKVGQPFELGNKLTPRALLSLKLMLSQRDPAATQAHNSMCVGTQACPSLLNVQHGFPDPGSSLKVALAQRRLVWGP